MTLPGYAAGRFDTHCTALPPACAKEFLRDMYARAGVPGVRASGCCGGWSGTSEIADDADVRFIPPKPVVPAADMPRQTRPTGIKPDDRLPIAHTVLTRAFKGRMYTVTVLPHGFEYDGDIHKSLTAVAHAITGSHWNGYHFFRKALTAGAAATMASADSSRSIPTRRRAGSSWQTDRPPGVRRVPFAA